jgi:Tat protein secretion system quality control protein TatD with DNase activity
MVKVRVIAHIVAKVKGIPFEELASAVWDNSTRLFYPAEVA